MSLLPHILLQISDASGSVRISSAASDSDEDDEDDEDDEYDGV